MIASHRSKNSLFQPLRGAAARCLLAAVPLAIGFSGAVSSANAEYSFTTINSAGGDGDFTQLLGINNAGTIAGYFGDGSVVPNNGFTIARPYGAGDFTAENFPGAVQTQVVGINNTGATVGFYIDAPGNNHGFIFEGGTYTTVDNPLTGPSPSVNQLLTPAIPERPLGGQESAQRGSSRVARAQKGQPPSGRPPAAATISAIAASSFLAAASALSYSSSPGRLSTSIA